MKVLEMLSIRENAGLEELEQCKKAEKVIRRGASRLRAEITDLCFLPFSIECVDAPNS